VISSLLCWIGVISMRHYPREQSRWDRVLPWRRATCATCGLPWMCDEAIKEAHHARMSAIRDDKTGSWSSMNTLAYPQLGQTGTFTAAQDYRGWGGSR
jgi:hypothetical protein